MQLMLILKRKWGFNLLFSQHNYKKRNGDRSFFYARNRIKLKQMKITLQQTFFFVIAILIQ